MKENISDTKRAMENVRSSLVEDKTLYDAFVASIESALREMPPRIDMKCMAKRIADRIIGR